MSSLLDQAIVDANALKEAALKNAQQKVLDLHSEEVRKAVDTLLEEKSEKKQERDPLLPDRQGLMTSPDLEVKVSKVFTDKQTEKTQQFGDLKDSFRMGDNERVSISFTALEEALDMEGLYEEDELEEDMVIDPDDVGENPTEEDMADEGNFDSTASNWGEMEEMSGVDNYGMYSGGSYVGGSDYMEEGMDELDEMEKGEMYSIGSERMNPNSESLEETEYSRRGHPQEVDMMKEEEYELDETLYGESDYADPLDEELDELYEEEDNYDAEDMDQPLEEVLELDLQPSNQGHLGFNPVHYKEQMKILTALEVHKEKLEKSKKKEKKLQEQVDLLRSELQNLVEHYSDLKTQYSLLAERAEESEKIKNTFKKENAKLTETVNNMLISNTKLLYTSKVLGNDSLNERQKQGLVENISKAQTIDKVKVVYETLQSGVQREERRSPKSLSEAVNRSATHFIQQKEVDDNTEQRQRMQVLAGIIRK